MGDTVGSGLGSKARDISFPLSLGFNKQRRSVSVSFQEDETQPLFFRGSGPRQRGEMWVAEVHVWCYPEQCIVYQALPQLLYLSSLMLGPLQ